MKSVAQVLVVAACLIAVFLAAGCTTAQTIADTDMRPFPVPFTP